MSQAQTARSPRRNDAAMQSAYWGTSVVPENQPRSPLVTHCCRHRSS